MTPEILDRPGHRAGTPASLLGPLPPSPWGPEMPASQESGVAGPGLAPQVSVLGPHRAAVRPCSLKLPAMPSENCLPL